VSTTFQIYPSTPAIPSFRQLLDRSVVELHRFLQSVGLSSRPAVGVRVQQNANDRPVEIDLDGPLTWNDDEYAWFFVGEIAGGTDGYFHQVDDLTRECLANDGAGPRARRHEALIQRSLDAGHYWSFRRSAGQPAVIHLAYGLIAGCLAELTSGLVTSIDSAWDFEQMPALSGEFLAFYFRPEKAISSKHRDWSECCIDRLKDELEGRGE
jgi:hypothetical protein